MNFSTIGRTIGSDPLLGIDYYVYVAWTILENPDLEGLQIEEN